MTFKGGKHLRWNLVLSNPDVARLGFYGSEKNIWDSNEERPKQRPSKSAKIHPAAKKCCGWEEPAICLSYILDNFSRQS